MEDISGGCLVFQSVVGNEHKSYDIAPNYNEIHFLAAIFFVTVFMAHPAVGSFWECVFRSGGAVGIAARIAVGPTTDP
ncbi:hypothetical protein Y032_0701g1644 [Ancylostoma ceylanicum]|uniref:Uncharacterized protein n=1 Tax=Ancylostoma ceylanicum TaxID=53326 RepID=A0A016WHC7_9BILA|nr:hypothetical protein Y032_0701g1644 [Ancylostoma ceylanicum]